MRTALLSLFVFLPAVSFSAEDNIVNFGRPSERFELPARGTLVHADEDDHERDMIPAPFSYYVCEELLSSEKAESTREQFDSRVILNQPNLSDYMKGTVLGLFNMSSEALRSKWWHAEFADLGKGEVSFRIVRSDDSIAYEKPIPRTMYVSKPDDESAERWAEKSPYVVLEERGELRVILFANNEILKSGEYIVSVEVPCTDVHQYLKLPIEDMLRDNPVLQRDENLFCRIEAMRIFVNDLLPKPWWRDREPIPQPTGPGRRRSKLIFPL